MKPYGLKKSDGRTCAEVQGTNKRAASPNKYCRLDGADEHGPKGKNRESKIHDQKRACHSVARAEERKKLFEAMAGYPIEDDPWF